MRNSKDDMFLIKEILMNIEISTKEEETEQSMPKINR